MSKFNVWMSDLGWATIIVVALLAMCIIGVIVTITRAKSPMPNLTITVMGLGDRQVAAGSTNVELARLKLTADAAGDVTVKTVTVTESFDCSVGSSRALCNLGLYADRAKVSGSVYAANLTNMSVMYILSIDHPVVVPAGWTVDLVLVGNVLSDASPDSRHIIRPGSDTRDGVLAVSNEGNSVPVRWHMPDDWPTGNVITIAAAATTAKP